MSPSMKQHIRTLNDVNGNPRRLWMAYSSSGEVLQVVDEGYSDDPWPKCQAQLPTIYVQPSEYKRLMKQHAAVLVRS